MKILVIEDERRIADSLKKGLELEGYLVDVVYDGQSGYDYASTENYNLVVLDRMLPCIDGLTICQKLRSDGVSTPIIMLTAKGEVQDRVEGLNAGADDYLPKPFSFDEFLSRVKALLRRPKKIDQKEVITQGGLVLNKNTFSVSRNNINTPLTHHEFHLLHFLMTHPNTILSKEKIIDNVWHFDADILPNTVEATIKNLRKKIEKPFKNSPQIIFTYRGLGYQLKNNV